MVGRASRSHSDERFVPDLLAAESLLIGPIGVTSG